MKFSLYTALLWVQGVYTLITGFWPLLHIESFIMVTGPKHDIWLVKTVAAVLACVGLTFIVAAKQPQRSLPSAVLAITSAIALASIDFYYTSEKVIRWVYAIDGFLQLMFIFAWTIVLLKWKW